ncbi:hypothetical protein [Clostridium gasigenes]|uniref:hypothetical protein n=1 Tax=Clostridium gasigenes TaxID=94869 RepID=UPI001C0CCC9F|nr:hypothetical protein [Clostridium gasigenes]MBU3104519.1 hypothetical protein [Clostridium gasigenes]MBU3134041.1 hypothetical protein [Clostridium gasigenes]
MNRYIPAYHLYEKLNNPFNHVDLVLDNTNVGNPVISKEVNIVGIFLKVQIINKVIDILYTEKSIKRKEVSV